MPCQCACLVIPARSCGGVRCPAMLHIRLVVASGKCNLRSQQHLLPWLHRRDILRARLGHHWHARDLSTWSLKTRRDLLGCSSRSPTECGPLNRQRQRVIFRRIRSFVLTNYSMNSSIPLHRTSKIIFPNDSSEGFRPLSASKRSLRRVRTTSMLEKSVYPVC